MSKAGQTKLALHEEILLLSLREGDGKLEHSAGYTYKNVMSAAVLAELILLDRIEISQPAKGFLGFEHEGTLSVKDGSPTGNDVFDDAISKISSLVLSKAASNGVSSISMMSDFHGRVARGLCDKGILKAVDGKILFFFDKTYYPELDPKPEQEILSRLKHAIFSDAGDLDERTTILVALLKEGSILRCHFDKKLLSAKKDRIEKISSGQAAGKAAARAIASAQAAIMAATTVATTAAVVSS